MAVRSLAVEFSEGKRPGVGEEGVEVIHRVEYCDDVAEGSGEADGILSEDSFGNVHARTRDFLGKVSYTITREGY
jgi:hypothetical protein